LIDAITSESLGLETEVLGRLAEEMSAKDYSKLVQVLEGETMEKYYNF
jgi:hypothetical protein